MLTGAMREAKRPRRGGGRACGRMHGRAGRGRGKENSPLEAGVN